MNKIWPVREICGGIKLPCLKSWKGELLLRTSLKEKQGSDIIETHQGRQLAQLPTARGCKQPLSRNGKEGMGNLPFSILLMPI